MSVQLIVVQNSTIFSSEEIIHILTTRAYFTTYNPSKLTRLPMEQGISPVK
jgi:hypothetical protein